MCAFRLFARKSLPDLDEEIDLDNLSSNDDKALLEELKKELEELKISSRTKQETKKEKKKSKLLSNFTSLTQIELYLKDLDEDFFNKHIDEIKEGIINFIEKVLPDTPLSFEISLISDLHKLISKVEIIRSIYGNLSIKSTSAKAATEESNKNTKANTKNKSDIDNTTQRLVNLIKENDNLKKEQKRAIELLKIVDPKKAFRLGNYQIRSLEELEKTLHNLPDREFNLQVLPIPKRKNLANWIEHVIGYKELAEKLLLCETKDEILSIVDEMYEKTKEIAMYGVIKEESETNQDLHQNKGSFKEVFQKTEKTKVITEKETHLEKEEKTKSSKILGKLSKTKNKKQIKEKENKGINLLSKLLNKDTTQKEEQPQQEETFDFSITLSQLLDKLDSITDDEFLSLKNNFIKILYKNGLSFKEIIPFYKSNDKISFRNILEEFLYSKPNFEEHLSKISEKDITTIVNEIKKILVTDISTQNLKLNRMKSKFDLNHINENKKETNGETYDKTSEKQIKQLSKDFDKKTEITTKILASLDKGVKSNEDNKKDERLLNQTIKPPLEPKKKTDEIKNNEDKDFFDYVSHLKQEIEEMKLKKKMSDLPPPTLEEQTQIKNPLFDLVKPQVHYSDSKMIGESKKEPVNFGFNKTKTVTTVLNDNLKTSYNSQNKNLIREKTFNTQTGHKDILLEEQTLLEKEYELLKQKLALLEKKRRIEKKNFDLIIKNIELNEEYFKQYTLFSKFSKQKQDSELIKPKSYITEFSCCNGEPTFSYLIDYSKEQLENIDTSNNVFLAPLSPNDYNIQYHYEAPLEEYKKQKYTTKVPSVEKPSYLSNRFNVNEETTISSSNDENAESVQKFSDKISKTKETRLLEKTKEISNTNFSQSVANQQNINTKDILSDELSLDDIIHIVDDFLVNDSFNEAKDIILKAKDLITKRSKRPLKLDGINFSTKNNVKRAKELKSIKEKTINKTRRTSSSKSFNKTYNQNLNLLKTELEKTKFSNNDFKENLKSDLNDTLFNKIDTLIKADDFDLAMSTLKEAHKKIMGMNKNIKKKQVSE